MRRVLTICMMLSCCLGYGFGQGIQGNVTLSGKATVATTGHSVALTWDASQGATSYCVYRGPSHGQYIKIASGILGTNYTDVQVTHSQTLYYATTAVSGSGESGYSNEAVVVIP